MLVKGFWRSLLCCLILRAIFCTRTPGTQVTQQPQPPTSTSRVPRKRHGPAICRVATLVSHSAPAVPRILVPRTVTRTTTITTPGSSVVRCVTTMLLGTTIISTRCVKPHGVAGRRRGVTRRHPRQLLQRTTAACLSSARRRRQLGQRVVARRSRRRGVRCSAEKSCGVM